MAQATDPVCKMQVDTEGAQHTAEYNGQTYYFCAAGCWQQFLAEPTKYI